MESINSSIISTLQSKVVSKGEFDFDKLAARPILSMIDYSDIDKLYNIASSIRYSGDIQKKLAAIRDIMHAKGFRKLAQGTNRIVYSYFEDPSIVLKIATDRVGMKDNPREFLNQELLKPFVTKIFEVTPDGVVGLAERVQPITSREEFMSCADDIFALFNYITRKYIMADIGTRYFMNTGIRHGFGGVLLDFPYLYEVDGNKLMCCAPNVNEPSGICGGWIDYDEGFNTLRCNKCGAEYKAIELAKLEQDNKIVRKGRKSKMKVAVRNLNGDVREISLDGSLFNNNEFKQATNIVRSESTDRKPIGNFKIKAPVVNQQQPKKVEEVVVESPVIEKKSISIKDIVPSEEVVEKKVIKVSSEPTHMSTPVIKEKNKGMKLSVLKDGKATEQVIEKAVEEPKKTTNVKINGGKPDNRSSRRNPVKLTAVTFEQLKELDFKYSSTDLEFHKMFFRSDYGEGNNISSVSVMVDFDSIPRDKLALVANLEDPEAIKDELEQAKADLMAQEEAIANLRKINDNYINQIKELTEALETERLEKSVVDSEDEKVYIAENNKLKLEIETLKAELEKTLNETEEVVEEKEETSEEVNEDVDSDVQGISFTKGLLMDIDNIFELYEFDKPKDIPSEQVIVFGNNNERDEDSDLAADQDGNIICISHLNNIPIDQLIISSKTTPSN